MDQVMALVKAQGRNDRAWALVNLAAALRREKQYGPALKVLDAARELNPGPQAEVAAYTCAVAIHCDLNDHKTARKVGEFARTRAVDEKLLRALGRSYWAHFHETHEELFANEARRCFDLAEELGEPTADEEPAVVNG
jgi:hypothetical protein